MYSFDTISVIFEETIFRNNFGFESLFSLSYDLNLTMKNVTFMNNINLLFFCEKSTLLLEIFILTSHFCSNKMSSCVLNANHDAFVSFKNSIFLNISQESNQNSFIIDNSRLKIEETFFRNFTSHQSKKSCIYGLQSDLFINYVHSENIDFSFLRFENSSLQLDGFSYKEANNYKNNQGIKYDSVLICYNCLIFIITNSIISSSVTMKKGAALLIFNNYYHSNFIHRIKNVKFIENKSVQGGAIFLNNAILNIYSSIFYKNQAEYGGAIYHSSVNLLDASFSLFINNSIFLENSAKEIP